MADEYLTPAEFAALSTREQLAVWEAAERGKVTWVRYNGTADSNRLYHRAQVKALLEPAEAVTGNG